MGESILNKISYRKKQEQDMAGIKEYKQIVASACLIMFLAVLPLYMKDGLNRIGDAKYLFFWNVSVLFLLCTIILIIVGNVNILLNKQPIWRSDIRLSAVDGFVLAFGIVSIISYCLSAYPTTALWGYPDWHMGLLVQMLMIVEYFVISRWYMKEKMIEACILLSAVLVSLLGILNRYELDPLKVFSEMDRYDWNRLNLLSTIGHINWYCGYLSVVVPLLAAAYWNWRGCWGGRVALGLGSFSGLVALLIQGSDSGYVVLSVMISVLLLGSLGNRERELRFLEIAMMLPVACLIMIMIAKVAGVELLLPSDTSVAVVVYSPIWLYIFSLLLPCYIFLQFRKDKMPDVNYGGRRVKKIVLAILLLLASTAASVFIVCQISEDFWHRIGEISWLRFGDEWGTYRGFAWRVTWQGFWESSPLQKLFGAGPDCYAEYMYRNYSMDSPVSGQVFANSHNEWLTMLLNEGVFGAVAYVGFFLTAFVRYFRRMDTQPELMAGALAVAAYCTHGIFSFQQVVSTPLVFIVIGMSEACLRASVNSASKQM